MEFLHKDTQKIEKLSTFMTAIQKDISGEEKKAIYEKYKAVVKDIKPIDLFYVDMYKDTSDLDEATIKASANKFVNVFQEGLKRYELNRHDHPFFQGLLDENTAITRHLKTMKTYFKAGPIKDNQADILAGFEKLLELEKKFVKKENILFPVLEDKVPSTKPLEVMWSLHDDARYQTKAIINELKQTLPEDETALKQKIGNYYYLVYGIIQKEALILYPVASALVHEADLDKMLDESFQYGFTFIEVTPPAYEQKRTEPKLDNVFKTATGVLNAKQLDLMLNTLPVDITYVDKDDKVRYFNDRKDRHFPRNPSIIGRLVKHCHPPKSVATVERIVEAFKSGEKDTADFWITFKGLFLYIRYFAVRDASGTYEGVLEVSQDVTEIRSLKGEKRLLDWH